MVVGRFTSGDFDMYGWGGQMVPGKVRFASCWPSGYELDDFCQRLEDNTAAQGVGC